MNRADRQRLVQSVRFFSEKTRDCIGRKLFKLLYLADAIHFQQTGQPMTGLEYVARRTTPLPHEFKAELSDGRGADLAALVDIDEYEEDGAKRHVFRPNATGKPDLEIFTRRELRILSDLAGRFQATEHTNIPVDQFDRGAWRSTALNDTIDFVRTLDVTAPAYKSLLEAALEYREHVHAA